MFYNVLQNARVLLCYLLAYCFSVTIAGALKAWVAKRAGDYTAEHAGFLTLDPLVHVDLAGLVVLLMTGFGWGRDVPVNVHNVRYPYRDMKILTIYYVQTLAHILMTSLAILWFAGLQVLESMYVGHTTIGNTFGTILQAAMVVNIFLAMLRFIQSSIDLICMHLIEQDPGSAIYIHLGSLLVTFTTLYFAGGYITQFFYRISTVLAALVLQFIS